MLEKITQQEINERSVSSMADRPNDRSRYGTGGLTAPQVKERFDALSLLLIARYNALIDAILDGSITDDVPTGINGVSFADLLYGVSDGAFAGYLQAYNDAGVLSSVQSILNGIHKSINDFGLNPPSGAGHNFGIDCRITCLGYYYKSIDLANKKIYLSREQVERPVISTADYTDESFEAPSYNIGQRIAIINHNKYYPEATIKAIDHNVITYEGDLGFTSIILPTSDTPDADLDDYSLFVINQPDVGMHLLKVGAFSAGIGNTVLGNGAAAIGTGILTYGDHGFAVNYANKAAWAAFAHGYGNEGDGFYSETGGRGNKNKGEGSRMFGRDNNSTKKALGSGISGKNNLVDAAWVHVFGLGNKIYDKLQLSQGSDVSGENNTLDGARNVRMHGKSNQVLGSDYTNMWGGSQSEVGGLENILDGRSTGATNIHMHGEQNYVSHRNVDMGGKGNKSSAPNQIIRGTYCAPNPKAILIIGGGTSDGNRKNAFEVCVDGGTTYITVNGTRVNL